MRNMRDTPELLSWFNPYQATLKATYTKRIKSILCTSTMIEKSVAYHTINEQSLQDGYTLTECQINKLVLLLTE